MAGNHLSLIENKHRPAGNARGQESFVAPPVDIYETPDGLFVMADLPGSAKMIWTSRSRTTFDDSGRTTHSTPGALIAREYELVGFRQFELSDKVDQAKITAELKQGVLKLHLPKPEEAKPRKIDVKIS
jgi:HSP20 family molecular chaperone IbpA